MTKQIINTLLVGSLISSAAAETIIKHDTLKFFVPDNRITLNANIVDDKGVDVTRAYFKSSDALNYTFVGMDCKENMCSALLPAPSKETQALDYIFLVKNTEGVVVKTQTYRVNQNATENLPSWQSAKSDTALSVKSELATTPETISGFSDSIVLDTVESGVRFGVVAGIVNAMEAGTTAGAVSGTSGGTVAAGPTATGMSGLAIGGIVGGAVLGTAAVGAAVSSSGSDSGSSESTSSTSSSESSSSGITSDEITANQFILIARNYPTEAAKSLEANALAVKYVSSSYTCTSLGFINGTVTQSNTQLTQTEYTDSASGKRCTQQDYSDTGFPTTNIAISN